MKASIYLLYIADNRNFIFPRCVNLKLFYRKMLNIILNVWGFHKIIFLNWKSITFQNKIFIWRKKIMLEIQNFIHLKSYIFISRLSIQFLKCYFIPNLSFLNSVKMSFFFIFNLHIFTSVWYYYKTFLNNVYLFVYISNFRHSKITNGNMY